MTPLPPECLHLSFDPGPFRMAMGLQATTALVEIDARYPAEMAERRGLLQARHGDVFAAMPGSEAARAGTLALVAGFLVQHHGDWFSRDGAVLHNHLTGEAWDIGRPALDPLEVAGRLVQEDLCLIDTTGPAPVLSAAVLCAPSRWRLAEKIGRPLADVHEAVPLYAERLSRPVDRFMGALQPGRTAVRLNWSVVDDGALFQVGGKHRTEADPSITAENAGERLFLRVERQTLTQVPGCAAVLFAIRVHSYPVQRLPGVPGAARDLAAAVRALPETMARYKSVPVFRAALLGFLEGAGCADQRP